MINSLLHVINSVLQAINSLVKVINYFQTSDEKLQGSDEKLQGSDEKLQGSDDKLFASCDKLCSLGDKLYGSGDKLFGKGDKLLLDKFKNQDWRRGEGGGNINLQHYQYSISSFISTIIRIYYTFVIILQISITFTIPLKVEHELNSISTFCRSNIHLTHEFQNNLCIPKYEVLSIPINKVKR